MARENEDELQYTDLVKKSPKTPNETNISTGKIISKLSNSIHFSKNAKNFWLQKNLDQFCQILTLKLREKINDVRLAYEVLSILNRNPSTTVDVKIFRKNPRNYSTASNPVSLNVFQLLPDISFTPSRKTASGTILLKKLASSQMVLKSVLVTFGLNLAQRKRNECQVTYLLSEYKNFLSCFSLKNKYEEITLETETKIRNLSYLIGTRYLYQIILLSQDSQDILSKAVVEKIYKGLSFSQISFISDSSNKLTLRFQRMYKSLKGFLEEEIKTPDEKKEYISLSLEMRCIRALVEEYSSLDNNILEKDSMLTTSSRENSSWTVVGLLTKSGVQVNSQNFVHKFSAPEKYGFCFGTFEEVKRRKMKLFSNL
eukprot:snap_masked-scaffold_8-processed-gene-1.11-mRNA-1 protein AED:1.00 eAED:1.00 QI:0/0/0/0/1/1/2/0/369